jgi:sterol 14-demethylase
MRFSNILNTYTNPTILPSNTLTMRKWREPRPHMENSRPISIFPSDPLWPTLFVVFLASFYWIRKRRAKPDDSKIPWAPGSIPVLGHAMLYRKDPSGFLVRTCERVGPIFQLNMAGKHMIVVCGPEEQRHVASAPESQLSARHAVAEIGFEHTLGSRNVHQGTDIHKGIVKGVWTKNPSEQVKGWMESITVALEKETSAEDDSVEFFKLVRRVTLRAVIERLISPTFLDSWDYPFLNEFMRFQDTLEDVTAKSVVLPRWLALPALLVPLAKQREGMQANIAVHLKQLLKEKKEMGFWLAQVHTEYSVDEIAEYIVGLLFAAHKNAAIGTAQAYLMLWERGTANDQEMCRKQAKTLLVTPDFKTLQTCSNLRAVCLETLRLTAHSIGAVRTAQQDFPIGDNHKYVIPKGATISLVHIASSLNPALWGENPQTFDAQNRSDTAYQDEYKFTTFSHGVHKCPGQQMALIMLQCTLAILLEQYTVELPPKIPPLSFERATLAQREGKVQVTVVRRSE